MRARIGRTPKYANRSEEDKDAITAGIWHGYPEETKRRLAAREGKKGIVTAPYLLGLKRFLAMAPAMQRSILKDFGGWTSHNIDWERGYREGERKSEDRMRGINLQKNRRLDFDMLKSKQGDQINYAPSQQNPAGAPLRRAERRAGLRYRAGERKEQHQGPGTVLAGLGKQSELGHGENLSPDWEGEDWVDLNDALQGQKGGIASQLTVMALHPAMQRVKDHPGQSCNFTHPGTNHDQWMNRKGIPVKSKHAALFIPIRFSVATKGLRSGVSKGDLVVEGYVSAPIKDLQGDILDEKALIQAKDVMTKPPYNHVWLDHFSPYAEPSKAGEEPPIGNFVDAKLQRIKGVSKLWVRMIVNRMHPKFKQVAYELSKGFYNAFSMEFVPLGAEAKMIGGKLANVITAIKYFATCLVRAPANEDATVAKVYTKAFANSSGFYPVRVFGPGWIGQTVKTKSVGIKKMSMSIEEQLAEKELEPEPEEEPELEPENEPEQEPEEESETAGMNGDDGSGQDDDAALAMRDYARETGTTAPERANTALGEWGDPALDKGKAIAKDHAARLRRLENYARATGKALNYIHSKQQQQTLGQQATLGVLKALVGNVGAIGKGLGLQLKGIDEDTLEALGKYDDFPGYEKEVEPPETTTGRLSPKKQRIITTFDSANIDTESVEGQEVGGDPTGSGYSQGGAKLLSAPQIDRLVRKAVAREVKRKTVLVKSFPWGLAGETSDPNAMKMLLKSVNAMDDGSIEGQLAAGGY